jgi:hypothetical protein
MKTVRLLRTESGDQGTFGLLAVDNFTCFTGELPWLDNRSKVSCIPVGKYNVLWELSPRLHKHTYRLKNVKGRDGVLIHSANLVGDSTKGFKTQLQGCIAMGEKLGYMMGQKALLSSRPAVTAFEMFLNFEPFILEIKNG